MICNNLTVNDKGNLCFAGYDTVELAGKYGTPAYFLDEKKIREKCNIYKKAMSDFFGKDSKPLFASKSLCFLGIYRIMSDENMGIDVVSSGEIYTAKKAGFCMENAFFHGNNKTDFDVCFAMDNGVGFFVCDNESEIIAINRQAGKRGIKQNVILRITPGIDPHTHQKISTGNIDSKFGNAIETGQAMELCKTALTKENINLKGFHCHIGSQIFDCSPFVDATVTMLDFIKDVKEQTGFETEILNLGGGMGVKYVEDDPEIDYRENIRKISEVLKARCDKNNIKIPTILMEPGRSIVADAGLTLYTVGNRKEIPGFKNYVSVDGGMSDNPRYTLYSSDYTVLVANKANEECDYCCTVAGRCCESGDLIQENIKIPKPERNDILAVLTTGAYNYSMASNYNAICKPPIIVLNESGEYVAVRRETFDDMTACQI